MPEITPVTPPMKEGPSPKGIVPTWLKPYADNVTLTTTSEAPLFKSLWDRAIGLEQPALSSRERGHLIGMMTKARGTP